MTSKSLDEKHKLTYPFQKVLLRGFAVYLSANGCLQKALKLIGSYSHPYVHGIVCEDLLSVTTLALCDYRELLIYVRDDANKAPFPLVSWYHPLLQSEDMQLQFPPKNLNLMLPKSPRPIARPSMGCVFVPSIDAPEAYVGWRCPICERPMMWLSQLSAEYFYMVVPKRSQIGIAHVAIMCPRCKLRTYYTNKPEQLYPDVQRLRTLRLA